jgi:hypothetical protein
MHAWLGHMSGAPHWPLEVQVWMSVSLVHCVVPGVHMPEQTPLMHAWAVQLTGAPHWPDELHVCTPLPEHCLLPGEHAPPQLPLRHTYWQVTGFAQAPLELHVSTTVELEHSVVPGTQLPVQPLPTHAESTQGTGLSHWPDALHVCRPLPEHSVIPGPQLPLHTPLLHAPVAHV